MKNKILIFISAFIVVTVLLWLFYKDTNSASYFNESQILWKFTTADSITSTPTISKDLIFVRTMNSIYALNPKSGTQIWKTESPSRSPLSLSLISYDDLLIAPEKNSRIAVFTINQGKLKWRTPLIDPLYTHPDAIDIEAVTVWNNILYVARFNWNLTAYDLQSGQILWVYDASGRSNPYLASDENAIYVGLDSKIVALDLKNGKPLWEYDVNGYIGPITIDENILFVLDEENSNILAIDINNQSLKWKKQLPVEEFEFNCILIQSENIYISTQKLIAISKKDGRLIWESKYTGRLECPIIFGEKIFVRNTTTNLFVFDKSSGKELSKYHVMINSTAKHIPNRSPVLISGQLIIPVDENELIAIYLQ